MCEKFSKTRTFPSQAKNIPTCQNQPWGASSFFDQFCTYKHIYTHRAVAKGRGATPGPFQGAPSQDSC